MQPYTVQKGDTLNAIAQKAGYTNYKEAGLTSKSGNPDMIFPGETYNLSPKGTYVNNVASSGTQFTTPFGAGTQFTTPSGAGYNTATGVTTPPPVDQNPPTPEDPFSTYLKSLEQPTEVTEATKYVNSLITQGKQDQEKALSMGETTGFATGEAARVGRQNAITLDAAARGLDALIASNASKKEIAKARFDYEKAKIDAAKTDNKGFELSPGQKRYEYDPKTGGYKEVASVASAPKSEDKVTAAEAKANAYSALNQFMQPGKKVSGVPVLDPEGYLTAEGFKKLMTAAKEDGISRKEFIAEYASYIGNVNSNFAGYGLTPAEIKTLGGI